MKIKLDKGGGVGIILVLRSNFFKSGSLGGIKFRTNKQFGRWSVISETLTSYLKHGGHK